MIYKMIEDKRWEYKCVQINRYELTHEQLDSYCNGEDGWEMVNIIPETNRKDNDVYLIILKRSYVEKEVEDE